MIQSKNHAVNSLPRLIVSSLQVCVSEQLACSASTPLATSEAHEVREMRRRSGMFIYSFLLLLSWQFFYRIYSSDAAGEVCEQEQQAAAVIPTRFHLKSLCLESLHASFFAKRCVSRVFGEHLTSRVAFVCTWRPCLQHRRPLVAVSI